MDETPRQAVPAGEMPQEAQRSLTLTVIEAYTAAKVVDVVVPDVYTSIKDGIKKGMDKIRPGRES